MSEDGLISKISAMFAVFCLCFLVSCFRGSAAEAELAPPQDLKMVTLNTNYSLTWFWEQTAAEPGAVTFTTQYVSRYKLKRAKGPKWNLACEETTRRSCDLTRLNLHYLSIFMLRVRANMDGRHSEWVNREFCPDKEAEIGPPSKVELAAAGSALDVSITDPLSSSNTSMKEHLPDLFFHIHYWERSDEKKVLVLNSTTNMVTLSDLKAWTWYCVSVQSRYNFYDKMSVFTSPQCVQTEGTIPWWQIFLFFLGSLLVCFLVVLLALYGSHWCYRFCKTTFFPHDQLPPHFKRPLFDSPGSDNPRLVVSDSESELLCEGVIVCPECSVLEIHSSAVPPGELEGDGSCRHLRQDSSSSGDSGVYSTGRSSSVLQPNSGLSFTDVEHSCSDSEHVKMMETGFKFAPVITAEAVTDVSV
ncbi:interleukin-10 receptor subunit beta [Kryptolebias marmoratus]|uniref:Interleukin 10 receptor, beta n=2 Tax=Kryptolebias marmoratus TaxID=37003 RepID=A0A3Q3AEC7_KRYMA|nr:interleukin-10 receptor subunit beta [Kryptolebias marmoratus]